MPPMIPGQAIALSPLVHRVLAPNPGMMTGPGTNSYLIGHDDIAVIDPGPELEAHTHALIAAADQLGGKIRWILCTHTHNDHSPGAKRLQKLTGARIVGQRAPATDGQDHAFAPDEIWADGSQLDTEEFSITAIHTPGHASNHLCYLLDDEQLLFTGDHIMQGSTVVIVPPDGDMAAYIASLRRLREMPLRRLAPGHGESIEDPQRVIDGLIRHRNIRELKVLQRLQRLGTPDTASLLASVYDDVTPFLLPVARYSLLAHLYKLVAEQRIRQEGDSWHLMPGVQIEPEATSDPTTDATASSPDGPASSGTQSADAAVTVAAITHQAETAATASKSGAQSSHTGDTP